MTDTTFSGPVRTGSDATPGNETFGTVAACQRRSVSADGVYAPLYLPACHISRIWVNTETAWQGSAGEGSTLRIGTSADVTQYGSLVLSAVGIRDIAASCAALLNLAEGARVVCDVTTVGTAGIGQASVYVAYHQT